MSKKDSLHQLIHSLDSSEKRLFKIYVSNNAKAKNSQYIELFDAISKLPEYDEIKLKKKLKHANTKKNLAQAKKYLKDLILKAMRDIDDESAADKVNNLLKEASFLSKKNLFKEQWKKLEKAKEIANKYELFADELDILDLQMRYLIEHDFSESEKFVFNYETEKAKFLKCMNTYNHLMILKNKLFQHARKNRLKTDPQIIANFKNEIDKIELNLSNSFRLRVLYHNLVAVYFILVNDKDKVEYHRLQNLKCFENQPHFITEDFFHFLKTNFNYLSAIFKQAKFDLLAEKLRFLENLKLKNHNLKGEYFQNFALYKILLFLNTDSLKEAEGFETYLLNGLKKFNKKINRSILFSIYYNYALVFFLQKKFQKSLYWLINIDNEKFKVRKDLEKFTKLLILICHLELENTSIMESLLRSLNRSYTLNEYEQFILDHIKAVASSNLKERRVLAQVFLKKIKKRISDNNSNTGVHTLKVWIEAKL